MPKTSKHTVTLDTLYELLRYDPESGLFAWREREPLHFVREGFSATSDQLQETADKWNDLNAGMPALTTAGPRGTLTGVVLGKVLQAHKVAFAMHWGRWPKGQIDHFNGDKADNRIDNLRDVTRTIAAKLRKVRGESGTQEVGMTPKDLWGLTWRDGVFSDQLCQEGMVADTPTMMVGADDTSGLSFPRRDVSPVPPTTPATPTASSTPVNPLARGSIGATSTVPDGD